MRLELIAFTSQGMELAGRLARELCAKGHGADVSRGGAGGCKLREWTASRFDCCDGLIFVGAAGIAVRAVAPFVRSKTSDPAVLVVDEGGRFVIPLLSGHIGGANALALELAALMGAEPVITTATDGRGLFAVDSWAVGQGLLIQNPERIKTVSARLLAGKPVGLCSQAPVVGPLPQGVEWAGAGDCQVWIGLGRGPAEALRLTPPLALGVGCRKGTPVEALRRALRALMERHGFGRESVRGVYSIDLKAREPGLLELCRELGLGLRTFSAEQLRQTPGAFTQSSFVAGVTGVDNVCERAAVRGGGGGALLVPKTAGEGVTMALAAPPLSLEQGERI